MAGAAAARIARRVGEAITKQRGSWFSPHMAAASRAIADRIPLVDLTLEVRDARIPLSSAYSQLDHIHSSSKRMIILNKIDLADKSQTQRWTKYFEEQNCICYGVNSHNKENIKEFLKFIQARIRELQENQSNYTATVMLIGIPNVGKSAIANSLHQIGRISAAEKGKLKHAVVSPTPRETRDISSYKIASHPNIYVLDTPGVLAPEIVDAETVSKLAVTGAIDDYLIGECELALYFLAVLNSSDEYKQWEKLRAMENKTAFCYDGEIPSVGSQSTNRSKQFPTDHTQDFIVRDVRRTLFNTISSFEGSLEDNMEMLRLVKSQLLAVHAALRVPLERGEDGCRMVATKLLNLYRIGRLGHYTLDFIA